VALSRQGRGFCPSCAAGTTWLSDNLRLHPGVWDVPVKAFRYFNEPGPPLIVRAFQRGDDNTRWRRLVGVQLPYALVRPSRWTDASWLLRFALRARTPEGYRALMTRPPGRVGGEVTPAYARLAADAVALVHQTVPEARIIYLLRNPVQRMWSQAAMHWRKQGVDDLRAALQRQRQRCSPVSARVLRKLCPPFQSGLPGRAGTGTPHRGNRRRVVGAVEAGAARIPAAGSAPSAAGSPGANPPAP
jgi:hypothetical protein